MEERLVPSPKAANAPGSEGDCGSLIILGLVWVWIVIVAFGRLITSALLSTMEAAFPPENLAFLSLGQVILLAIPILPLAWLWKNPSFKAIFQTWAFGLLYGLLLFPAHFTPPTDALLQAVLRIALSILYALILVMLIRRKRRAGFLPPFHLHIPSLGIALLAAALIAIPWLAWGALGSPLDTTLQLFSGLFFGIAAAFTLNNTLFPIIQAHPNPSTYRFLLSGFSAGTALLIMASLSAFSYYVMQIILMLSLPALGWILAGLYWLSTTPAAGHPDAEQETETTQISHRKAHLLPLTLLIGLSAAAPMMLIDPDELYLIVSLSAGEILQWAMSAAGVSLLLGLAVSFILFLVVMLAKRTPGRGAYGRTSRRWLGPALLSAGLFAWLSAGVIYFLVGQPGFYGENLFVILKDQADVSSAYQIEDYEERRQFVYTTLVEHALQTQASLRQDLEQVGVEYTPYYMVNGIEVNGGPALRLWLNTRSEVDRVLSNPVMRPLPEKLPVSNGSAPPPNGQLWNLELINAYQVWEELGVTGEGIVIGQSDSGVQWDHPELMSSYRGWDAAASESSHDYNWHDPWFRTRQPVDYGGHGTHTTGTAVGDQTGVAPDATWYACANLARNLGNPALYISCMQFMLAPFPLDGDPFVDGEPGLGAHVINNSWGCPDVEGCDPYSLMPAVRALRSAGIFVVASAGNNGPACGSLTSPPPIYDDAFAVGAVNASGALTDFSSRGPVNLDTNTEVKPDIVAPGDLLLSSMPGDTYGLLLGTSMAGPHVTGVVALMWSANPDLIGDIDRTEAILYETAQPYTGPLPNCPGADQTPSTAVGYGIVDAYAAVQAALSDAGSE